MKKILSLSVLLLFGLAACQKQAEPYMDLSSKSLNIAAEGGQSLLELRSNVRCRVCNDISDWVSIDTVSVSGDLTVLSLDVKPYEGEEKPRTGRIRFIGDCVEAVAFKVNQAAVVPEGISNRHIYVECDVTTAVISVLENKPWTATSDNPSFTLNPDSGDGQADIVVSFPQNNTVEDVVANITVVIDGTPYVCVITQAGNLPLGMLADWDFAADVDKNKQTFNSAASKEVGFGGQFVAPTKGKGKIEYYACDKSSYPGGGLTTMRGIGSNGDPYVRGTVAGDYWLITADYGKRIPAGTKLKYSFVTHFGNYTTNYWLLEYLDGDAWKPVSGLSTVSESADRTMSGADISYSAEIKYNVSTRPDAVMHGCYDLISGTFTTSADMTSIVLRFSPVGRVTLTQKSGEAMLGKYIDKNDTQVESRLSAQRPNNDAGNQVKTYDQHLTIEFVTE